MGKIRVLNDNLANQIAAGEVVERPASVAKELLENALDAGAKRLQIDIEAGGRRLLRISDDGEGMNRDDAVLAFERHATSKLRTFEDLSNIITLGFRGEALASIASVARVELITKTANDAAATRVEIEGGRLKDVKDAARSTGTTISVRDLFFNVPARRKFMRSEATENFHLMNLITHYALVNHETAFTVTNNGREVLRLTPAKTRRERAFQIFGGDVLESFLNVEGGNEFVAKVSGYVSAPRERRTTRDAQYFFINGRFVRDKVLSRAVSEGFRSVLPHGVYPVAVLFLDVPLEEVDVNVHPQKTEVRFRRTEAVKEMVAEAIRQSLAAGGFVREFERETITDINSYASPTDNRAIAETAPPENFEQTKITFTDENLSANASANFFSADELIAEKPSAENFPVNDSPEEIGVFSEDFENRAARAETQTNPNTLEPQAVPIQQFIKAAESNDETLAPRDKNLDVETPVSANNYAVMPPVDSASKLVKEIAPETLSTDIRPLGQLHNSYIIAVDSEGLLLIDQHVVHERILFDKFRKMLDEKATVSQNLLLPETFDLTPAQAIAFDALEPELEAHGFAIMRLSGRTIAVKSIPTDLPPREIRNLFTELLDTIDRDKRGAARSNLRDEIAAMMACKAAVKVNMRLSADKMQWLIDRLVLTSNATTCPHGRPIVLRLTIRDIEKGFHRA